MTTNYPLTPDGVQAKLSELYALPDVELVAQADLIAADFRLWVTNNFILNPAQKDYIDGMNADASRYFGLQCSICFHHRLPIGLIYPAPPTTPGYTKWTGPDDKLKISTDGNGNIRIEGSFTFIISYEV